MGKLAGCLISLASQSTTPSFHSSMFDDNIERDQRPACLRARKKRLFDLVLQSPAGTIPCCPTTGCLGRHPVPQTLPQNPLPSRAPT